MVPLTLVGITCNIFFYTIAFFIYYFKNLIFLIEVFFVDFLFFFLFVFVLLIFLLIFAKDQHESAIGTHMSLLSWTSLPSPSPSHPL